MSFSPLLTGTRQQRENFSCKSPCKADYTEPKRCYSIYSQCHSLNSLRSILILKICFSPGQPGLSECFAEMSHGCINLKENKKEKNNKNNMQ